MGYFFRANNLNWSLFIVIVYSGLFIVNCNNLLGDFGINTFPDKTQINISLQEYTTVISGFLKKKNKSLQIIPELKLHENNTAIKKKVNQNTNQSYVKMIFPVKASATDEVIESARLHLLLPAQKNVLNQTVTIQVNQILGVRRKHFLDKETFYLNESLSKWCDIDITSAVLSWIKGHRRNLGLELICLNCTNNNNINPHIAAITAVVHNNNDNNFSINNNNNNHKREKRSEKLGRTDCSARHLTEKGKKRCCRHDMIVNFNDIKFMKKVFVPNFYEAGYCHGMCPPDYNFATNHSRIQGYLHQRYRKSSKKSSSSSSIPKTCCAPSKFGDLEIVIPDKTDPTKLQIEKWDNMIVLECACS